MVPFRTAAAAGGIADGWGTGSIPAAHGILDAAGDVVSLYPFGSLPESSSGVFFPAEYHLSPEMMAKFARLFLSILV